MSAAFEPGLGSNSDSRNKVGRYNKRGLSRWASRAIDWKSCETKAAEVIWPAYDVAGEPIFDEISDSATTEVTELESE